MSIKFKVWVLCLVGFAVFPTLDANAFEDGAFRVGLGYLSQNIGGKITKTPDGAPSGLGTASIPLLVKYDLSVLTDWFFSPQLSYTVMARKLSGDVGEATNLMVLLPFGTHLYQDGDFKLDWQTGPGVSRSTIEGSGGIETMPNGTSTAAFAKPARDVVSYNAVFGIGLAANYTSSRIGLDLLFDGLLSSGKRTQSFMFVYTYSL